MRPAYPAVIPGVVSGRGGRSPEEWDGLHDESCCPPHRRPAGDLDQVYSEVTELAGAVTTQASAFPCRSEGVPIA